MASEQEGDEVWGLLQRARRELDELATMVRNHVGIDWGGTSINSPHPSIPIPYREIHGPSRESVDATHDMSFVVDFDESVITLHKASLSFRVKAVRSNVSAATGSSGGGSTSGGAGGHRHRIMAEAAFNGLVNTGTPSPQSGGTLSAAEYDSHTHGTSGVTWSGRYMKKSDGTTNIYFTLPHVDTAGDMYSFDAENNHQHTTPAHTHPVTLTYGIYEGPAPVNPNVSIVINGVDVTTALGGPWDTDATLDITSYLREESGDPLRQANTIVLSSDELIDLEVVCKSLVSAASPLAIGAPAL